MDLIGTDYPKGTFKWPKQPRQPFSRGAKISIVLAFVSAALVVSEWIGPRYLGKVSPRTSAYLAMSDNPLTFPVAELLGQPVNSVNINGCMGKFNAGDYERDSPIVISRFNELICQKNEFEQTVAITDRDGPTLKNASWSFWDPSESMFVTVWRHESLGRAAEVITTDKVIQIDAEGQVTSSLWDRARKNFGKSVSGDNGLNEGERQLAQGAYRLRGHIFAPGDSR